MLVAVLFNYTVRKLWGDYAATQSELEARALIAGDLLKEGEVKRVEVFRVEMDALLGENTGDLKFENNTDFKDGTM